MSKKSRQRISELENRIQTLSTPASITKDITTNDPVWSSVNPGGLLGLAYSQSHTGVPVTWQASLSCAAVMSAVRALSEDTAKLPLEMRRLMPKGGSKIETKHPLVRLLRRPNYFQTPFDFWAYTVSSLVLRGNGYIYVQRNESGEPQGLIPINPDRVTVRLSERGIITYGFVHPMIHSGTIMTTGVEDMIHLKGFVVGDGITGISPIVVAADAIGVALASQRQAALMFGQGTMLGGVLQHPGKLSKEAGERVASSWTSAYSGGANAHKVALLEEGMSFQPLTMTSIDSELIEARKFSVVEISRIFRVPLSKLSVTETTFNNMEAMNQSYLDDSIIPLTTKIEQALSNALLFESEIDKFSFRFNFDEMLRADTKTRYAAYQQGILSGWLSANEIRSDEGMEPIPGADGDVYRFPVNTAPGAKPTVNTPEEANSPDEIPQRNPV